MMMAKEKSEMKDKFRFLLMLPLMGLLIALFSCEPQEEASPAPPPPPMEVFDVVENMPRPTGGLEGWTQYLTTNLKYPSEAKEKGITGTVYLTFIVDTEGSIQHVQIFKGIGAGLDEEAIEVVKNAPKWEPGTHNGKKVNVKMRLPIRFALNTSTSANDNLPIREVAGQEAGQTNGELKVDASYANGNWSGVVRDQKGKVVPGAAIVLPGSSAGTVSDINGRFSIETSQSANLNVSYPGYRSVGLKGK